jgi:hypothetical protein
MGAPCYGEVLLFGEARWSGIDRVFTNHDLEGFTASFYEKIIVRAGLDPSTYRIRLEALQNLAELNDVPGAFRNPCFAQKVMRLNYRASNCTISRPSQRPCAQSQIACVGRLPQSQVMCAETAS